MYVVFCAGTYSWPTGLSVSSQVKDLVARMLCVGVDKRISVAEIEARCPLHACDAA